MIGFALAAVFGGLQFYLMTRVARSVARGRVNILAMVGQFFCPMIGLLVCALVAKRQLLPCAVTMSVILIGGALALFIHSRRKGRHEQEKRD